MKYFTEDYNMLKEIEKILESYSNKETKLKDLERIQQDLNLAKEVLDGKMKKCKECIELLPTKVARFSLLI